MYELYLEKPEALTLRKQESLPAPLGDQVKVKVIYAGICGSDLRVYKGSIAYADYPVRPGHEAVGIVTETGENAKLAVGTKVVVFPNTYCGKCEFCLKGNTNVCREKKSFGINIAGVFGSEFITEEKYLVPVPKEIPDERAVLLEPLAVTVHALKKGKIGRNTSVAIIGCGTEGMLAVALAAHAGADVTVIDVNPNKFDLAKKLGNIKTAHPSEVNDQLFDVVIEAAGVKASIEQSMQLVKPCGHLISIGITGDTVSYPSIRVVRSEITIHGSIIYTKQDFADAIELLRNPQFAIEPVVSKIHPLDRYKDAYRDALSGQYVKIIINFKEAQE